MRSVGCGLLLAITVAGCSGGGPPLDELPLRDALRAEPEVVAALPDDVRARLASRLQAVGAGDTASDPVDTGAVAPALLVTEADTARAHRSADALVVGLVGGGAAQAMPAGAQATALAALPPIEGLVATSTAALETRALAGAAGAAVGELMAASGATRLERVVGWPVAAVAIGDTVYVNGAWLVALAPAGADGGVCDSGACDAGAGAAGRSGSGTEMTGAAGWSGGQATGSFGGRAGMAGSYGGRGGAGGAGGHPDQWATGGWPGTTVVIPPYTPPPPPPPPPDPGSTSDAADACAAAGGDGSDDSCSSSSDDGSADSCSGSSEDDSGDACGQTSDGTDASCQTAPGRHGTRPATIVWLFAPLIYLWGRKR